MTAPPADGLYPGVSMADYRAWDAWGSSDLKTMRVGPPAMVEWRKKNPSPDTDATRIGTACHAAILEGDSFADRYAFKPEGMTFASNDGKAWRAAQAGKIILTPSDQETVNGVVVAFETKPAAYKAWLASENREASIVWTDPETGARLKARPDWYGGGYVYDLKVSRYAVERSIPFRAWCEGWMHQAAFYRVGLRAVGVAIEGARLVVVHPAPPHPVFLVDLKPNDLDVLALENAETIRRMVACRDANHWPGTPEEWQSIDLPPAALAADLLPLAGEPENA